MHLPRTMLILAICTASVASGDSMPFTLTSSAFTNQGSIPTLYTCEGNDTSPALSWSGVPSGTKSLALIVSDPDAPDPAAPQRIWTHWVLFNLPPTLNGLPEGVKQSALPREAAHGLNDWDRTGWGGPCPPIGRHRYYFRLYALDTVLDSARKLNREQLEAAMRSHILATAELMGTYQKGK